MYEWLKKNGRTLLVYGVIIGVLVFLYACESRVRSLDGSKKLITRTELVMEFNAYIDKYDMRFASLDRQDKVRQLVINNAMLFVQGSTLNPVGIITAILGIYGVQQAAKNTSGAIKDARRKRNNNKSPTA